MLTNLVKQSIYSLYPKNSLQKYKLDLGYIFHTEWIYHQKTVEALLQFCENYKALTGKKVICTIMTAVNPLVTAGMKRENCSAASFIDRVKRLSELATLGYHGHFWLDDMKFQEAAYALHSTTFVAEKFLPQFERDLNWFEKNNIIHNGIYAGGWWFFNAFLAKKLMEHKFTSDYSFSKAPYFFNAYSMELMNSNKIKTGESLILKTAEGQQLLCIQNLIGAHDTPFPLDFDRNLKKILDAETCLGVINAHDYDRSFTTTLKCIEHLLKEAKANFHNQDELVKLAHERNPKTVLI